MADSILTQSLEQSLEQKSHDLTIEVDWISYTLCRSVK